MNFVDCEAAMEEESSGEFAEVRFAFRDDGGFGEAGHTFNGPATIISIADKPGFIR